MFAGLLLTGIASCGDNGVEPFVPVATTITFDADDVTFRSLGASEFVGATVVDQQGGAMPGAAVTWMSMDPGVVTVSAEGILTAAGNGTAMVTASSGAATGEVNVMVVQVAASASISPDSVVLADPGDTVTVTLTVGDTLGSDIADPTVTWLSSDEAVATVSDSGVVTGVATGTAVISAQVGAAVAAVAVRVAPELTLLVAGPDSILGEVATEVALSVRVEDVMGPAYPGATVTWTVDSGGGQIVSATESTSDGTGHTASVWRLGTGAGLQHVTASIESRGNTVVASFVANALPSAPASALLVADSVLLSAAGETVYLAPTYADVYGNPTGGVGVSWTSSDPAVAMVAADGLVTGVAAGSTYVTPSFGSPSDSILVTVVPRGAITVTFDDGWLTTYAEAFPLFEEFGLPANVGVNSGVLAFPAYMDLAQLNELHDAGWSMVSHTVNHANLTTLSDAELDYELRENKAFLDAQGFRGTDIFIVPYHEWGVRERNAAAEHYRVARGVAANFFMPDSLVQWMPTNPYDLTGMEADSLPYTTVAGRDRLRAMLERTVNEGVFLDLFFHQVPSANVAALRETLIVLDEFRDRILPYHELYPKFARVVF